MRDLEHGTVALPNYGAEAEKIYSIGRSVSLGTRLRGLFGLCLLWHGRWKQRLDLAELNAHLLQDIGVTPRDAFREADKPFWQA